MSRKIKGYTLGAIAAASYGTNPLFTLPLYAEGISPDSVLFFRYLFALPILAIMLKSRGRSFAVSFADIIPVRIVTEFPASEADAKAKEIADRLLKKA